LGLAQFYSIGPSPPGQPAHRPFPPCVHTPGRCKADRAAVSSDHVAPLSSLPGRRPLPPPLVPDGHCSGFTCCPMCTGFHPHLSTASLHREAKVASSSFDSTRASARSFVGPAPRQSPIAFLLFAQTTTELLPHCTAPCAVTELPSVTDEQPAIINHHRRHRYSMLEVGSVPSHPPAPSGVPPRGSTIRRTERAVSEPPEHCQAIVLLCPPCRQLASGHDLAPFNLRELYAGSPVISDSTIGCTDHSFEPSPSVPHRPDHVAVEEFPR
jgi:hypothetical protein